MVLMAILGGKGTIWGPVLGAAIFHLTQELFWTYLLGWQRVALGILIVLIVVFFPQGIIGWLRERYPERLARFEREARMLAAVHHPHVATLFGIEEHEGRRVLVMECVAGETLAQRLARGPLPVAEAVAICRQVVV